MCTLWNLPYLRLIYPERMIFGAHVRRNVSVRFTSERFILCALHREDRWSIEFHRDWTTKNQPFSDMDGFRLSVCVLEFFRFFGKRPKNKLILLRFDLRILMCQTRKLLSQGCHSITNLHYSHIRHIMAIQSWWHNG